MQSSLLRFIDVLRSHSLPVSPAETMDAATAMALVGFADRESLADALATTLAKSRREEEILRVCFDRFFDPQLQNFATRESEKQDRNGPSPSAGPPGDSSDNNDSIQEQAGGSGASDASSDQQRLAGAAGDSQALRTLLAGDLLPALLENQRGVLSAALRSAAADVQLEQIRLFTQKGQYTRRILDALGEGQLRDAVIELERSKSRALDTLRRYRDVLREQVRDFVEKQYLLHAQGHNDALMDDILGRTRLANIDRRYIERVRLQVHRMARKLASRHSSRRRRVRRGQLHMSRTLRAGIAHDGILLQTHWRNRKRPKAQVMALCDVSGSVAAYAGFLLMFLYSLQDILPRMRSFAFSHHLGEISDLFQQEPLERAIELANWRFGGATDYGASLRDFSQLALHDIDRSTSVIILGDARNNRGNPELDIMHSIYQRSKQVLWLNPEPRQAWGTGDSEMLRYQSACHVSAPCSNLQQLERVIDQLLKTAR